MKLTVTLCDRFFPKTKSDCELLETPEESFNLVITENNHPRLGLFNLVITESNHSRLELFNRMVKDNKYNLSTE